MAVAEGTTARSSVFLLRATRRLVAAPRFRVLAGASALTYGVVAMLVGGMLEVSASGGNTPPYFWIVPRRPGMAWYFPAILAGGPHFALVLPIVSTILMLGAAAGVGLGMSAAVAIGIRVLRPMSRSSSLLGVKASVLGLTPAFLAVVTLGACCSTTAAATAGIVAVAQASGTTPTAVLANTWYLGLFQVVVVYLALLAQEQLVAVFGLAPDAPQDGRGPAAPSAGRSIAVTSARLALVAVGVLWAFSGLTYWFSVPLADTPLTGWFNVLAEHLVPGSLAVLVGLNPRRALGFISRGHDPRGRWWGQRLAPETPGDR